MAEVSTKCLALRYLSLRSYEDPELLKPHEIKLQILNKLPRDLVIVVTGHLHDAAVRVSAEQGANDQLIWFDFMTILEDTPGYATRIGTETMDNWNGISPPAFYIVCFPKAPEYVAIVPHQIAWENRDYWCNTVAIPGPYFPYVLEVDHVHEALQTIASTGAANRYYKNPGTGVVLHRWLPARSPIEDFLELCVSPWKALSPVPEPTLAAPQSTCGKRRHESSTGFSAPTLPPPLRAASRSSASKGNQDVGDIPQVLPSSTPVLQESMHSSAVSEDDMWAQWLEREWLNNQQWWFDFTAPTLPQGFSTSETQADTLFIGRNSLALSSPPWRPEGRAASSGHALEPEFAADCTQNSHDEALLVTVSNAPSPTANVLERFTTALSPLFALPSQEQTTAPNTMSPVPATRDLVPPASTTPGQTCPSQAPTPQHQSEYKPRRMLELYNLHPWGNHIYLSGSAQLTPSLLLAPATPCLLLLTSYTEIYLTNTPTPLQNLLTAHPCIHIIASVSEPDEVWIIPSRDVQAYTCHLQALKQGTVNALGAKMNARCGLRGKNKRKTESPCVRDVIEWVGALKMRVENLERELGKRFAAESKREKPRGVEDGEMWRAVATMGEVLQAQVDWVGE